MKEILDYIIKQAIQLMGVDTGILYRLHKKEGVLVIRAAVGVPVELIDTTKVPIGTGAIGQAVLERKPVVINDVPALIVQIKALGKELEPQNRWISSFCNGMVAVPLLCKDEIYGGIALYLNSPGTGFLLYGGPVGEFLGWRACWSDDREIYHHEDL